MVRADLVAQVVKLCKDCRHYLQTFCTRPGSYRINLVTGHQDYTMEYLAEPQRWCWFGFDILSNTCGRRGRFWEKSNNGS